MLEEFKAFVNQGNALDLAGGGVVGAAAAEIVTSLVNAVIMPVLGLLFGHVDFRQMFVAFDGHQYPNVEATRAAGASSGAECRARVRVVAGEVER